MRIGNLLSAGLSLRGVVDDFDDQLLRPVAFQRLGDIEAERVVAAFVRTEFLSVEVDGRFVIDGSEMKQDSLAAPPR